MTDRCASEFSVRQPEDIKATGAAFVTETELAWLCDEWHRLIRRTSELEARLDSIMEISEARTSDDG